MKWIALSSFSGSEILDISKYYTPDAMFTNNPNSKLLKKGAKLLSPKPTSVEYMEAFGDCELVTLHGWNKIIPADVCEKYNIFNIHPGDIVNHPDKLKGNNPYQAAIDHGLTKSGVVIHKCIPEVDSGEIVMFRQVNIAGFNAKEMVNIMREYSINLWLDFLDEYTDHTMWDQELMEGL
jgi:methionyl-tRNA formyltransferase